jgi:decaprenyl-phosphate phosphoribosyltransferase
MNFQTNSVQVRQQAYALIVAARPKQWIKNLLVFAAPISAGSILEKHVLFNSILSGLAFTFASITIYLWNDIADIELDKYHPKKKLRPFASGQLAIRTGYIFSFLTAIGTILISLLLIRFEFFVVIGSYVIVQLLYVRYLKHKAIVELYCVASGFLLRAIGGGVASGIVISKYFLIIVGFSALFIVSGKRFSEKSISNLEVQTRPSLKFYTEQYLRFFWTSSFAISLSFYALWVVELNRPNQSSFTSVSLIPYSIALFKYAQYIESKNAEAPEDLILKDPVFLVCITFWLLIFGIGYL